MDAHHAIASLGGIATRAQLLERGFSGTDLTGAVRRGQIWRVRRAHYAIREAHPPAVQAVRVGGRLCGVSAAATYGLWHGLDARIHVAVATNAGRLRTNFAPSRPDQLTPDMSATPVVLHWIDVEAVEAWRVGPEDCLREVVRWSDSETAVACLDTARTVLGFGDAQLAEIFAGSPIEDGVIASRSEPGSDSGPESMVRQRLSRCGVRVRQQIQIEGVGRVDMGITGTKIVIEVDGHAYHSSRESFENDRRRDAELASRGFTIIRLSYDQVMNNWAWCERLILATIALS